ncbi:hypothetical protein [Parvularcula maris]|uniref:Restriction endonuclease n=1 Tax=Parvularcula maris TaxID=2965077 RepID=A0A9X2LB48_9PROT|nr:hypothetical protein [Parvularcula maris]MCQ8186439.1 hypothetical protein [Parvularcula maris]
MSNIQRSNLTIYDEIPVGDPDLWIPTGDLEQLLSDSLIGASLAGLPIRTRSKVAKSWVAEAMGYSAPPSFQKTQPRFPGQLLDTYVQKANNLQIWNEELSSARRYVLIRVDSDDVITRIKVVNGDTLAVLDTTGTLTQKYQARFSERGQGCQLFSSRDTDLIEPLCDSGAVGSTQRRPEEPPSVEEGILPIADLFEKLRAIVGNSFKDSGAVSERSRGEALHRLVCKALGYTRYGDNGQFPDVRNQLLEVKLQTSPTIDLGLVLPNSDEYLDVPQLGGHQIRHCDVRYAVFDAKTDGTAVAVTGLVLITGRDFFNRFVQFQGRRLNKKLQIPLPSNFFSA